MAIATPFDMCEFDRIPFGLANGPAIFQRLVESCQGNPIFRTGLVYFNDVELLARSVPEMLERL